MFMFFPLYFIYFTRVRLFVLSDGVMSQENSFCYPRDEINNILLAFSTIAVISPSNQRDPPSLDFFHSKSVYPPVVLVKLATLRNADIDLSKESLEHY